MVLHFGLGFDSPRFHEVVLVAARLSGVRASFAILERFVGKREKDVCLTHM